MAFRFRVDELLGDHQTVIKNLRRFYHHVRLISGATILGRGVVALMVALILDQNRLVWEGVRSLEIGPHREGPDCEPSDME